MPIFSSRPNVIVMVVQLYVGDDHTMSALHKLYNVDEFQFSEDSRSKSGR